MIPPEIEPWSLRTIGEALLIYHHSTHLLGQQTEKERKKERKKETGIDR